MREVRYGTSAKAQFCPACKVRRPATPTMTASAPVPSKRRAPRIAHSYLRPVLPQAAPATTLGRTYRAGRSDRPRRARRAARTRAGRSERLSDGRRRCAQGHSAIVVRSAARARHDRGDGGPPVRADRYDHLAGAGWRAASAGPAWSDGHADAERSHRPRLDGGPCPH